MANRILVTGGAGFIGTRLVNTPGFCTTPWAAAAPIWYNGTEIAKWARTTGVDLEVGSGQEVTGCLPPLNFQRRS